MVGWVQATGGVRQKILKESHTSKFSIHPGATKMYRNLRLSYWWPYMKRDIAWFVEWCLTYRKVKGGHQQLHGKAQPLPIPMWKWEEITMDIITKLLRTARGCGCHMGDY